MKLGLHLSQLAKGALKMSRENVPSYDGTPETLPSYKEKAIQYAMTIEYHKRYLCGPRLLQSLTGVAKVITRSQTLKNPQWLSHPRGVYQLLEFLEEQLAKPSLVDASRHVLKFFYNLNRSRGESMTEWIARHTEALWEASAALRRVQKEFGEPTKSSSSEGHRPVWSDWGQDSVNTGSRGETEEVQVETTQEETPDGEEPQWHGTVWTWNWAGSSDGWSAKSWHSAEYEPPTTWDVSEEIFIPEFLAGFLLLHRSGLDPSEKSNILGSIKGKFNTATVGKALREQWSDADLAKRDKAKMNSALWATEEADDDDAEAFLGNRKPWQKDLKENSSKCFGLNRVALKRPKQQFKRPRPLCEKQGGTRSS